MRRASSIFLESPMFLRPLITILAVLSILFAGLWAFSKPQPPVRLVSTRTEPVVATTFDEVKGNIYSDIHLKDKRVFEMNGRVLTLPGTPVTVQAFSDGSAKLCFELGQAKPWCHDAWASAPSRAPST